MSLPVISTPDISSDQLKNSLNAAQSVTNYAQAIATAVPRPDNLPSWYDPINADIDLIQDHAQQWLDEICPAISTNIPDSITQFNEIFQESSADIIIILNQIIQESDQQPTPAQRQLVSNYLNTVKKTITEQSNIADDILSKVKTFAQNTNADQQQIAKDLNLITNKITSASASIDQMQAIITDGFLDSDILGPCSIIVTINLNISLKVTGLNPDPTIIGTVYTKAILENLLGNLQTAQKCVQTVVDAWAIVQKKFGDVITDLDDASSDEFAPYLEILDFNTARKQWQELSDFASSLIPHNYQSFFSNP